LPGHGSLGGRGTRPATLGWMVHWTIRSTPASRQAPADRASRLRRRPVFGIATDELGKVQWRHKSERAVQ
jgi:hypothetical protein